jgi:hypothetical protein
VSNQSATANLHKERLAVSSARKSCTFKWEQDGFGVSEGCARMHVRGSRDQSDPRRAVAESFTTSAPLEVVSLHHRHILNPIRSAYETASMRHLGGEAAPS